ncbi:ABC transporter substrate-binding protein [Chloroflexota bacterium]
MRHAITLKITILLGLLLVLLLPIACDRGTSDTPLTQPTNSPSGNIVDPVKDVVITIGNLSDLTGPSAGAQELINMALDDMISYYNDENLIPGIELKTITYDGQFDPSNDIPGYEWLIERGADLIWTAVPGTPVVLKPRADKDQVVVFCATIDMDELTPPGYVFSMGNIPQYDAYTLLKWIADNDWDYRTNGPAKIGGASWSETYSEAFFDAMKAYANSHPEQFEFVGGYLTNFTFTWGPEVDALKDCDYVFPCLVMPSFVQEYRNAGYTGKFIGSDPHLAILGMIDKGDLWDEIDGMLFIRATRWWNEDGSIINLAKKLLQENRPDEAEDIIRSGCGYLAAYQAYQIVSIIEKAVEAVGPENVDSTALYEAAQSYTEIVDGLELYSFDDTKRCSTNYYEVCKADAAGKDLFRIDPD